MSKLNLFVSSTCYDLSQVRANLSDFISDCGHTPVLSEYENFPVNPQLSTIENCIKNVKENADILILIVGNRYGSIIETGKSITNVEFLTARQKGIPIFCFIDKRTLMTFSVWRENKDGNYEKFVDNPKVFEFIESIRSDSKIWTFEFERAQEIVSILKVQLSYLFKESLRIRNVYEVEVSDYFKLNLSNKALRILVEKPEMYEYEFFFQTLADEMFKKDHLKNDVRYGQLYDPKSYIGDVAGIPNWIDGRLTGLRNIISSLTNLINHAIPDFLKAPGIPADLSGLYYVSRAYARLYESLLNWSLDVRSTHINDDYNFFKEKFSKLSNKAIAQVEEFPQYVMNQLEEYRKQTLLGNRPAVIESTLVVSIDENDLQEIREGMERIFLNKF